ncbi:MAG: hypothetical protein EBV88_02935 [Actinobacteria bacterium]|nr:hypothetical protein [Actinomycetota bacterium]
MVVTTVVVGAMVVATVVEGVTSSVPRSSHQSSSRGTATRARIARASSATTTPRMTRSFFEESFGASGSMSSGSTADSLGPVLSPVSVERRACGFTRRIPRGGLKPLGIFMLLSDLPVYLRVVRSSLLRPGTCRRSCRSTVFWMPRETTARVSHNSYIHRSCVSPAGDAGASPSGVVLSERCETGAWPMGSMREPPMVPCRARPQRVTSVRVGSVVRRLLVGVTVLAGVGASAGCGGEEIRAESGEVVAPGSWSVFDLRAGDCIDAGDVEGDISDVGLVPCDQPHTQEVFATVDNPETVYPGASELALWADGACLAELRSALGLTLADGVFISYLLPSFDGWNKNDDRTAVCVLVFPDRGSVIGSYIAGTAVQTAVSTTEVAG